MPDLGEDLPPEEQIESCSKNDEPPPLRDSAESETTTEDQRVPDGDVNGEEEDLFANGFGKTDVSSGEEKDGDDLSFDSFHAFESEDPDAEPAVGNEDGRLDDDFEDFQGFGSVEQNPDFEAEEELGLTTGEDLDVDVKVDDDFDDFQAFESAPLETVAFDASSVNQNGGEGGSSGADIGEDEEDDFGDFEDAASIPVEQKAEEPAAPVTPLWERLCPVPPSETVEESSARKLEGASVIGDDFGAILWDPDLSSGFKFSWPKSLAWQKFLDSLKMDARNAVTMKPKPFNPDLPVFAASLSSNPLQPMSVSATVKKAPVKSEREEVKVVEEPVVQQESVAPSKQQAIPPAKFDWAGSGLANPLADGESPSLPPDALREFEAATPSPLPTAVQIPSVPLSSAASSAKPAPRPPAPVARDRSKEVNSLILRVPDLSFMRSKILIFPATGGLN